MPWGLGWFGSVSPEKHNTRFSRPFFRSKIVLVIVGQEHSNLSIHKLLLLFLISVILILRLKVESRLQGFLSFIALTHPLTTHSTSNLQDPLVGHSVF